MTPIQSC